MVFEKYLLASGLTIVIGLSKVLGQTNHNDIMVVSGIGTKYIISQKKAERALVKLSKTAKIEDSWIYYKNELIDNGKNELPEHVTTHFPIKVKTDNGDTIKVKIDSGETFTMYHNHTSPSPPSIEDIANYSFLKDSVFTNNNIIAKVADNGNIWEFSLEDVLVHALQGKKHVERFKILESKINIAYDPTNKYKIFGYYPYPYTPNSDKKYKEYISIMKEIGVKVELKKSRLFFHK